MIRTLFLAVLLIACKPISGKVSTNLVNPVGKTVRERLPVPAGYQRVHAAPNSFTDYLRNIPLRPDGSLVHYYNGSIKPNNKIYIAVLDIHPGNKDLMQCADAVMRLRAGYLHSTGQYDKIHFTFTNGFRADYSKWRAGYRVCVKGNRAEWVKGNEPVSSNDNFKAYLEMIYSYCGTLSLSRELKHVDYGSMQPGDVLIKGGSPGHAEIVMDVAVNAAGNKIYLLAQSYMPAQEIQILLNPSKPVPDPWYELDPKALRVITPQYDFSPDQLMRFE